MTNSYMAIIGGSGLYQMEGVTVVKTHSIDTPFGRPTDLVKECEYNGQKFFFLARHGEGHRYTPSEVNYAANIYALKTLGVRFIISISAVGSLKEELAPTHFVIVDQFIDWTKGQRARTFFNKGIVGHVSNAEPIYAPLKDLLYSACQKESILAHKGGSYICIEGPQFSTKAESQLYRTMDASVIGMTNVPEAFLAKEAGIAYATMAMVTDFDCWKDHNCSVAEIMQIMKTNYESAQKVVKRVLKEWSETELSYQPENQNCIMTNEKLFTEDHKTILKVLLS